MSEERHFMGLVELNTYRVRESIRMKVRVR